jgi:hypothetical protein
LVGGQERLEVQLCEGHVATAAADDAVMTDTAAIDLNAARLASDPTIPFEVEHVDVDGDRAVIRWRVTGAQNYRGADLMRVRNGKIVEPLGYGAAPAGGVELTVVPCSAQIWSSL